VDRLADLFVALDKTAAKASNALSEAVNADLGRIGATDDDAEGRTIDTRRSFATKQSS
jgi:hypothetical protein